jgi:hypothetical protein
MNQPGTTDASITVSQGKPLARNREGAWLMRCREVGREALRWNISVS